MYILMILYIKIDVKYIKILNVKKRENIWIYKLIELNLINIFMIV